jgi:hypothetical protein
MWSDRTGLVDHVGKKRLELFGRWCVPAGRGRGGMEAGGRVDEIMCLLACLRGKKVGEEARREE